MAIPDYQKLMLPVLTIAAEGEIRVPVAAQKLADTLGLTEAEREEMLPSGSSGYSITASTGPNSICPRLD